MRLTLSSFDAMLRAVGQDDDERGDVVRNVGVVVPKVDLPALRVWLAGWLELKPIANRLAVALRNALDAWNRVVSWPGDVAANSHTPEAEAAGEEDEIGAHDAANPSANCDVFKRTLSEQFALSDSDGGSSFQSGSGAVANPRRHGSGHSPAMLVRVQPAVVLFFNRGQG